MQVCLRQQLIMETRLRNIVKFKTTNAVERDNFRKHLYISTKFMKTEDLKKAGTVFKDLLTLNVPCISETCIEIKIKPNCYFHISVLFQKVL